jgi:hypothetical protein
MALLGSRQPSNHEELKGKFTSPLAPASWLVNWIDVAGCGTDMVYYHKYFNGTGWKPQGTYWENFGGNFSSPSAVAFWGTNRLNTFRHQV